MIDMFHYLTGDQTDIHINEPIPGGSIDIVIEIKHYKQNKKLSDKELLDKIISIIESEKLKIKNN